MGEGKTIPLPQVKKGFPIYISHYTRTLYDKDVKGSYKQWIVMANGFIMASFNDPGSCEAYLLFLKANTEAWILQLPKTIYEILEQADVIKATNLKLNGKG